MESKTRSLRTRLLALVGVAATPAVLAGMLGVFGMSTVFAGLASTDDHVTQLLNLGDLRDMEGDSRVAVLTYVEAAPDERKALRSDIGQTDANLGKDARAYLAAGSTSEAQRTRMREFLTQHVVWVSLRNQALDLVDSGRKTDALATVSGDLAKADDAMAEPLDALMSHEATDARAFRTSALGSYHSTVWMLVGVVALGLALAIAFALWQAGRILRLVRVVRDGLARLAQRDLTWTAPDLKGRDELTSMAHDAGRAMDTMRTIVSDLTSSATALNDNGSSLSAVSAQVAAQAGSTSERSTVVARSATSVSASVQTAAAATEQLTASINEIAVSSSRAAEVATTAVSEADAASRTISKLGDSSAAIGEIVKTINSIAEQTNLLALNATIEAARAGEAGKGFAVVASEVKELAQETARATEDIGRRVELIQADTTAAVDAMGRVSSVIEGINGFQTTIASAVEEQTVTTAEMARSIADAADGATQMADTLGAVAEGALSASEGIQQAQVSASDLARLATDLERLVGEFRVG